MLTERSTGTGDRCSRIRKRPRLSVLRKGIPTCSFVSKEILNSGVNCWCYHNAHMEPLDGIPIERMTRLPSLRERTLSVEEGESTRSFVSDYGEFQVRQEIPCFSV
jgi:hypothetical protein